MPRTNVPRLFEAGRYYHVYNRGINKGTVFAETSDSRNFLRIISELLAPARVNSNRRCWLGDKVKIAAYCLMGNHYHLLLRQDSEDGMTRFMKSLVIRYTHYFNEVHDRSGPLFDGAYRARPIWTDQDLVNLARYIHKNPSADSFEEMYLHEFSSLRHMVDGTSPSWLDISPLVADSSIEWYIDFVKAA